METMLHVKPYAFSIDMDHCTYVEGKDIESALKRAANPPQLLYKTSETEISLISPELRVKPLYVFGGLPVEVALQIGQWKEGVSLSSKGDLILEDYLNLDKKYCCQKTPYRQVPHICIRADGKVEAEAAFYVKETLLTLVSNIKKELKSCPTYKVDI